MEEEFYAVVKLKNSEEFFSQVCPTEEDGKEVVLLYHPVTITIVKTKRGPAYSVEPWIKIGNEGIFVINKEDILTMSELEDVDLIKMHNKYVASRENTRYNEERISSTMGYVGTVSEAKHKLERIYNGS
jgi:hypothetical protein